MNLLVVGALNHWGELELTELACKNVGLGKNCESFAHSIDCTDCVQYLWLNSLQGFILHLCGSHQ